LRVKLHRWNDIEEEALNASLRRRVVHTARLTIARLNLKKGCVVPSHAHENEQVCTVESGRLKFICPDGEIDVGAGESLEIPSLVPHSVVALEDSVVVDLFAPRREDWISGDDAYLRR
jgi:quercetin dioxygenase-like cupin family protein